jgi:hypothetical protein
VDTPTLAALLYRSEGETLDFKSQQYPFYGGEEGHKSELLKDILAFANGWAGEPAYILIGVAERAARQPRFSALPSIFMTTTFRSSSTQRRIAPFDFNASLSRSATRRLT